VKDSSAFIEKRLVGFQKSARKFLKLLKNSGLDSSVIRVISIRIDLGWISQIVIKLALFIKDGDFCFQ